MDKKELFKKCLKFVLQWEGGFVNDKDDKGGATNNGITQRTYNSYRKNKGKAVRSVVCISDEEVEDIYYSMYWIPAGCDKMNPKFAALCFDTAVNMGVEVVPATGMTRNAEFLKAASYLYPEKYIAAKKAKYEKFAKYGNQKKFLDGWLNRLSALEKFIKTL